MSHLTVEPGHHQFGLPAARNEPDLDPVIVAEDQKERHGTSSHVRALAVQAGVVDVRRLKPGPGDLALGVLAGLVERLDLVNKS